MVDIQRIHDELEIRNLVARFADLVNRKATAEMREIFTPDAELEIHNVETYVGIDAIITFLTDILSLWSGIVHAVHSGLVTLPSILHPNQAKGRFYLSEFGVKQDFDTYVGGVYSDDYVRTLQGFRFARRRFDLLYLRIGTSATAYPFPSDLT